MYIQTYVCTYVCLEVERGEISVYWHVMGDASGIEGYDRRRSELEV